MSNINAKYECKSINSEAVIIIYRKIIVCNKTSIFTLHTPFTSRSHLLFY